MTASPTAAVIGWPIAHSRSPLIHRFWLQQCGIDGLYERIAVPPEQAESFFGDFAAARLVGANVTVPHKEVAARHCACDRIAAAIGAVNTLWWDDGTLRGTNSDLAGLMADLDEGFAGWRAVSGRVVIVGAGGAARSALEAAAATSCGEIAVLNRTVARAEALAAGCARARAASLDEAGDWLRGAELLINASSMGMQGQPPLLLDLARMAPDAIVYDLVYVPLETPLLAAARSSGRRGRNGLGMLLHQARVGFRLWFGIDPEVSPALRTRLADDVAGAI